MATTLDLAEVKDTEDVDYKSLLPLLKGSNEAPYASIFNAYTKTQRAITFGDYKLIIYPKIKKTLLFDLSSDPLEMTDISEQPGSADIVKACFQRLVDWQEKSGDKLDVKSLFPELLEI